jgi:hypothetical protein
MESFAGTEAAVRRCCAHAVNREVMLQLKGSRNFSSARATPHDFETNAARGNKLFFTVLSTFLFTRGVRLLESRADESRT